MPLHELVKKRTPRNVVNLVAKAAAFYGVLAKPSFPSAWGSLHVLRRLGWKPDCCIDVGAYRGEWALMFLSVFPEAKVLMIEAQEAKEPTLKDLAQQSPNHLEYAMALLGEQDGQEVTFHEMETGSSIHEEQSHFPRTAKRMKMARLDTLLAKHPVFRSAQMVKLDTQGSELSILRGSGELLASVEVVLLEVSLVATNLGAPRFAEVIAFMDQAGFQLFDFCSQIRRKDRVLWQTDLMFVSRDTALRIPSALSPQNWG
jgi:FkbM family methyltransferase